MSQRAFSLLATAGALSLLLALCVPLAPACVLFVTGAALLGASIGAIRG